MQERRTFLKQVLAASALGGVARAEEQKNEPEWPLLLFEKPVQALSYDEIADKVAAMGAQGIEATIRGRGHILQDDAAKKVPGMMKSLAKAGLKEVIASTHVSGVSPENKDFLKVLRDNGITRYRMNGLKYDKNKDLLVQVRAFNDQLKRLAELNHELGLNGMYQLHSGWHIVGALSWDAALMLEGIDPKQLGLAFDLRHSRTDSGLSTKVSFQLLKKHTQALFIKDAIWSGKRGRTLKNVPLDTGFVTKKDFDHARSQLTPMPLSLHMEWGEHQVYPKAEANKAWELIQRDMEVLKRWRKG